MSNKPKKDKTNITKISAQPSHEPKNKDLQDEKNIKTSPLGADISNADTKKITSIKASNSETKDQSANTDSADNQSAGASSAKAESYGKESLKSPTENAKNSAKKSESSTKNTSILAEDDASSIKIGEKSDGKPKIDENHQNSDQSADTSSADDQSADKNSAKNQNSTKSTESPADSDQAATGIDDSNSASKGADDIDNHNSKDTNDKAEAKPVDAHHADEINPSNSKSARVIPVTEIDGESDEKPLKDVFILVRPFVALGRYLRDSWRELRQVRWPNRKTTWKMTLAVIIYCVIFFVFIALLDIFFTFIFNLILGQS